MLSLPLKILFNILTIFNSLFTITVILVSYYIYTNKEDIFEFVENSVSKLIENIRPNASVLISRYYNDD